MKKSVDDDVTFCDGVTGRDLNLRLELQDPTDADVVLEVADHVRINPVEERRINSEPSAQVVQ